ncbi:endolytic transglycosylase MltG [Chengkuizengella sediminis]|uniref:endolytic transglycosylase MltG n=1 Tax=Chengkuizengella sediminis TaxID=1885917 RepID=UPI00138944E0|nr:endolytic transglycosylase MltG [Chengkuizengella sediminis]NDI33362.1 endolytic transglycosylase MltG [Chengkuizengella sediminis]
MLGHKYFYYGFGIGMTLTALLLLFNTFVGTDVVGKEEEFDVYKLKQKANELNYSVYHNDETRFSQEQFDAKINKLLKEKGSLTNPVATKAFLIQEGMNSNDVGIILFELDLISEIEEFETVMTEFNLHRKIKKGYYIFEESDDLTHIINKITE